jgi:DNA-3-methyladenine glycosylase II
MGTPSWLRLARSDHPGTAGLPGLGREATYQRLCLALPAVDPQHVLSLGDDVMRACAISRQKSRYLKLLAEAILEGMLDLAALSNLSNSEVAVQLMQITGIGQWTADVYRLMCLARPDIWPCGDVALAKALQEVKRLSARPDLEDQLGIAEPWRPYRAAAARLLWHHYLCRRGRQAYPGESIFHPMLGHLAREG